MHKELVPDPYFILVSNPKQPLHARNFFKNKIFWKGIIKNLSNQKGPGTSDQSLFRLQNKFTRTSLLVIYYLTKFDGVIYSSSWVIPKIITYTCINLYKPIYDIINYSISICSFKSRKCGKEEEKLPKVEYLENEKSYHLVKK